MKSGFTRTGKRTFGGLVDDGVKAVTRYYLNNFQDGAKQDSIDLMTGTSGRVGCAVIEWPFFGGRHRKRMPPSVQLWVEHWFCAEKCFAQLICDGVSTAADCVGFASWFVVRRDISLATRGRNSKCSANMVV
jgi:hypothetical protein